MFLTLRKLALLMALLAAVPFVTTTQAAAQAVISNGTVTLGVNTEGQLNVPGPASAIVHTPLVGLRYNANNWEALSHHSPCEGWGVGIANENITGWANLCFGGPSDGGPVFNLRAIGFSFTGDSATSDVRVANPFALSHDLLQVTHSWMPSGWPTLYQGNVTIRNVNGGFLGNVGSPVGDIRYRRVMDWDIEPTTSENFVTIGGIDGPAPHTPAYLLFSGDNGFEVADPLRFETGSPVDMFAYTQTLFGVTSPVPCGFTRNFTDCGRFIDPDTGVPVVADHGAMFDFAFPALAPGAAHEFAIFYGAAASKEEAELALYMVGAEVYSFANCRPLEPGFGGFAGCDPASGAPVTFIFAAAGVGGSPVFGDISGLVYQDLNDNGAFDGTDTPLAGVSVVVVGTDLAGHAITRTTTTAADGTYVFMAMPRGTYSVSSPTVSGALVRSTTSPLSAPVGGAFPYVMMVDFGYVAAATVRGTAYTDVNGNTAFDAATDTPLAGVTITVSGPGGTRTATTAADGSYTVGSLLRGTYTVSAPAAVGGMPLVTPGSVSRTLSPGGQGVASFGYAAPATVRGSVYTDTNGNNGYDTSDTPLAGVTVTVSGPGGTRTTTTGANGGYSVGNLAPGLYSVSAPAAVGGMPLVTPGSMSLTLGSGGQGVANFGYAAPVTVRGTAYTDVNGNIAFDTTDTPLAGVTITVSGPSGTLTTTTGANGGYSVGNLVPGTYTVGAPASVGGMPLVRPGSVNLTLGGGQQGVANFGYAAPVTVRGTAYTDVNGNTALDTTDTPLSGVTITLSGPSGTLTATTGANGGYTVGNLVPGTYTVSAPATVGGQPLVTPGSMTLTLGSGQQGVANFGYRKPVAAPTTSIGGTAYTDVKRNHRYNPGIDTPLAGVTITLTGPGGTRTATTGADGTYSFTGLAPGRYRVSAPSKFNGEPIVTDDSVMVTLAAAQYRDVYFGYKRPPLATLHGVVFLDDNGNSEFNRENDSTVAGLVVRLTGPGGVRTTTTDAEGKYKFAGLPPGVYTLTVPATLNGQPLATPSPVTRTLHGGGHKVNFGYKHPPAPDCRSGHGGDNKNCKDKGKDRR